ncbi:MAG: tyrosine-type recombinase/integrase [Synergistaceae bacterium]|jgi:integrase/recombinase XerC|nr:tyrosine-type recombinase/integrase [Synergistaceae bacterium]
MNREKIDDFLEYIKNKSTSAHTFINYSVDLKQFADYLEQQKIERIEDVDASQLRAYLRSMSGWNYSKASISRKLSVLKSFFSYLQATGVLERNASRSLHGPSAPKHMPKALSMEAMNVLFEMAAGSEEPLRDTAVIEVLYGCGLRISELVGLKWENVDLEERWLVVLGKGAKKRRVPFGSCAQKALRELMASEGAVSGPVFAGRQGQEQKQRQRQRKPLTVRTVHRIVTTLAARGGLAGVTPHVLRHSCATHLLEKGASLKFVQELLGHENMATTQIYLTINASWMKESYMAHHPRADLGMGDDDSV